MEGKVIDEQREILMEILEREGSHSLPQSADEMKALLIQTAHKCLIQNGAYTLEALRSAVPGALQISDVNQLYHIYETKAHSELSH